MRICYDVCEHCDEQHVVEHGCDGFAAPTIEEFECACGNKFCQECVEKCDGCQAVICNECSFYHWDSADPLCRECAQPLYTGIAA
jgi:hypothetical protein